MASHTDKCLIFLAMVALCCAQSGKNPDDKDALKEKQDCLNETCTPSASSNKTEAEDEAPPRRDYERPHGPDPYDRDGRYWLVPPFLIGASSVIVVYIIMHCFYLHCYTKRQMKQMARKVPPAIILSDSDQLSQSSMTPITPIVKYEGAYGKTELMETQPFLFYQSEMVPEDGSVPNNYQERRPSRRKSSIMQHLQLPGMFRRPSQQRPSVCSAGSVMETAPNRPNDNEAGLDEPAGSGRRRKTRASICFVPVGRTISDPSGSKSEWTPLQGFVYSSVLLARNPSYQLACGNSSEQNSRLGSSDGMSTQPAPSADTLSPRTASQDSEGSSTKAEPPAGPRDVVVKFEIDPDINFEDAVFEGVPDSESETNSKANAIEKSNAK